jgi:WD40 repeat protein
MNQPIPDPQSQEQSNLIQDTNVRGDLIFAPVQIGTKIETQIVQISVAKVTQQRLIKTSPYQGLKKFNFQDRERFFGRDKLIARLFEAVNSSNLSLVLGASGSGKSSVVRAGLIPELKKSLESQIFYDFIFTPNQDPFDSLYRCLLSEEKNYSFKKSEAEIALKAEADTLTEAIGTLKKNEERWLIFIDQVEELFTICQDPKKCKNFIDGIVRVAKSGDSSIKIILAMRADFVEQLSSYPDLGAIANQNNIHLVTEMYPDELRQAIEQPAARYGVVFEEGLVEQIIKEVEGQKGFLPLLQYTLNLLWESECKIIGADGRPIIESRTLNKASYTDLEGVRGALQKHIDEIYTGFSEDEQTATKQIFLKLVNIVETDSGSKTVSRRAYRDEFVGQSVNKILDRFIDEKLLVSSSDSLTEKVAIGTNSDRLRPSGTIEIAHEILLSSWDVLKKWIEQDREAIILKNWLASETRRWQKIRLENESKANDELLKGSRLVQVEELKNKNAFENVGGLRPEENKFIDASVEQRDRQKNQQERLRKRIILGLSAGLVGALSLSGFAGWQWRQAEITKSDIMARSADILFSQGKELDALMESLRAGVLRQSLKAEPSIELVGALQQAVLEGRERNRLEKDSSWARSVNFSPDGKTLASGSDDNTIKFWDVTTGREIRTLKGHSSGVNSVSFSPDGKTLASGSSDKTIKLWDVTTGREINTLKGHNAEVSVNFSSDGKTLASGSRDNTIKLWDVTTGREIRTLKGHSYGVRSVSYSPDGKTLASGSYDNTIKLWDVTTSREIRTLKGHSRAVWSVNFSPDGKTLASGSYDHIIKLWDVTTGREIYTLKGHSTWVNSVNFSPDGKTLASGSDDNTIKLWDVSIGREIYTLKGHSSGVNSVNFSPDGKTLAASSNDNTIKLWDVTTDREIGTLKGHSSVVNVVNSVNFSPDGKTLASGSGDNTIKLWDVTTGQEISTLKGHSNPVSSVNFSPDGKTLASGSGDNTIKLWDASIGKEIHTFKGHSSSVSSVNFSPDGKTLASGSGRTIKLWDVTKGRKIRILKGHSRAVWSVSFSPDGKTLASGSDDNTIKLWDVTTGQEIRTLKGHSSWVTSVNFSPDGKTLASGSNDNDNTIKLWDVNTGQEIRTLKRHSNSVNSVNFSSDGKTLASGSSDSTVILWNFNFDDLLVRGCDQVRAYLHNSSANVSDSDRHLCDGISKSK